MINTNGLICLYIFTVSLLLHLGCSSGDIGGTGSQAGNGIVTATVVYDDNSIASNAEIYVRNASFLKSESDTTDENYVELTNGSGYFALEIDSDSNYVVEVRDGNGFAVLVSCNSLAFISDTLDLDTILIEKTATLSGEVDISGIPDSVSIYVQIYGIDKVAKVNTLGQFHFDNIPSGAYNLKIKPIGAQLSPIDSQSIALGPNDSLQAGKFLFPRDFWKDTVIIREILDLNNHDTLAVDSVVRRDPQGRITDLLLLNRGIDTLPPSIRSLRLHFILLADNNITIIPQEIKNMLSLEHLDMAKNNISMLPRGMMALRNLRFLDLNDNDLTELPPDFGKLRFLEHFSCRENRITTLPPSIGMIENLKVMDLYENLITMFPFEVTFLKNLDNLDVQYNKLIALPPKIEAWIDQNSNTTEWKATQSN